MWTLILTLILNGNAVHSISVPNLPSKEICRQVGAEHVKKYTDLGKGFISRYAGAYTCVETK